ncbi:MAG TPA: DNA internalization-related competence protein ComEC/Rec2 [Candidatus Methylomirabilis sp.]|nr:DNA internalization-related competence protein ComEC/Rec2 [Candidatus Methylomirabilis sp.]
MRLPAVALAAAFACGAVLGGSQWLAPRASSHTWIAVGLLTAGLLVGAGILLARSGHLCFASAISLLCWVQLGLLGAGIANQPRPADHVLSLLDSHRIELTTPLRWHGRLRDEPTRLPWGYSYEVELTGVEYQGAVLRARGGLRVSFSSSPSQPSIPDVHAGDEVTVTTQARLPQIYRDDGAFDRRAYLSQQGVDLVATLRAAELMDRVAPAQRSLATVLAHARRELREELDTLFSASPRVAGVLRAMLLGDRSFVERAEAIEFQKTGVFHVLVVAGLHVGALGIFVFWITRKLRLAPIWTALITLAILFAYVALVEQRPPILRAAMMTAIVVIGGLFFRRLDLLNSAGIAALLLLIARPQAVRDSSFQLTFLAIGCIAGWAVPWLETTVQPYAKALRTWRDATRDTVHEPRAAQFRIDLRFAAQWISSRLPAAFGNASGATMAGGLALSFRVCELLVITLALQIGMLPLMARDFHRITLSAPILNLVAVPLTGIVVPLGFLTLGAGLLLPAAGKLAAVPLRWVTLLLVHVVGWFAHLPRWSYRIPGPPEWLTGLFLSAAVILAATFRASRSWRVWAARCAAIALAAGAVAIAIFPFAPKWSRGKLEMTVLDVGQGDSIFVVSPRGRTMLMDGGGSFGGFSGQQQYNGPDPGEDAVSPYLWSRGFQRIDVVALTHAHQDHIGGLAAIFQNFHVGALWIGREVSSSALANLEELCKEQQIPILRLRRGDKLSWDGVEEQFLWPENLTERVDATPKNNDSLVLRLKYGERALMLPGDAEKEAERTILAENAETTLRADVLKVGHHGSKNSTTADFLAALRPQIAVISAGEDNPYGHPNAELLERLANAGVRTLRTDRNGAVQILTDGKRLDVSCFVACIEAEGNAASTRAEPPNQEQQGQQ